LFCILKPSPPTAETWLWCVLSHPNPSRWQRETSTELKVELDKQKLVKFDTSRRAMMEWEAINKTFLVVTNAHHYYKCASSYRCIWWNDEMRVDDAVPENFQVSRLPVNFHLIPLFQLRAFFQAHNTLREGGSSSHPAIAVLSTCINDFLILGKIEI
jgi:hypothetical protein